jgi:uncharacterized protein YcbK (DUF882 family)/LysM repeat protein
MTRWIGIFAVATTLLSSLGANAATPTGRRDGQALQAKTTTGSRQAAGAKGSPKAKVQPAKGPKLETHRVFAGQTLGRIAKRYNVSIDALCNANGITRKDKIQPGQKLFVPARSDKDGSEARRLVLGESDPAPALIQAEPARKPASDNIAARAAQSKPSASKEQAASSRFPKVAPARAALPARGTVAKGKKSPTWSQFKKPAAKKGYVVLNATGRNWKGYAIVKGNKLSSSAQGGFNHALYSWRTGRENQISPALIRLLTQVSDTFGGRPLRVVSGYREHSHAKESRHKLGHACDFTVVGVPNEALRDYLLTFDGVGVGYYPNSSFVHLDVRRTKTVWVDFSGPGQRPRYRHDQKPSRPGPSSPPAGDFLRIPEAPTLPDMGGDLVASPTPAPSAPPSKHDAPVFAASFNSEDPLEARSSGGAAPSERPQQAPAAGGATARPPSAPAAKTPATGPTPPSSAPAPLTPSASAATRPAPSGGSVENKTPAAPARSGAPSTPARPVPPGSR